MESGGSSSLVTGVCRQGEKLNLSGKLGVMSLVEAGEESGLTRPVVCPGAAKRAG